MSTEPPTATKYLVAFAASASRDSYMIRLQHTGRHSSLNCKLTLGEVVQTRTTLEIPAVPEKSQVPHSSCMMAIAMVSYEAQSH